MQEERRCDEAIALGEITFQRVEFKEVYRIREPCITDGPTPLFESHRTDVASVKLNRDPGARSPPCDVPEDITTTARHIENAHGIIPLGVEPLDLVPDTQAPERYPVDPSEGPECLEVSAPVETGIVHELRLSVS
jgi:hypothetical protein